MYESFYKLRAKPFQLNPDPRFFYGSKGHKRAMAYLEYGLSLGEGFIVITGEVGAGKTMLVRNLFQMLQRENIVAAQLVSTQLEADDTLRLVAAAFGLDHENVSKAALLKKLENFLLATVRQGRRPLLVVDEAQNLAPRAVEELRMLSNFHLGDKPLLQSFLLGQPEFRRTLQSEDMQQLRQRIIASYHLGPMDMPETRAYIEHRLHTAGWQGDPAFADDAFQRLHEYSGGIPRRINTLADRLMLLGYLEGKHQFDQGTVDEVIHDLEQELAYAPAGSTDGPRPAHIPLAGPDSEEALHRLEYRIDSMEKTLNRLMTMTRKLLFHATGNGPENAG